MAGGFAGDFLEQERGAVEQFQGAIDSLEEVLRTPFGGLIRRSCYSADLGHGRETIVHFLDIPVCLPRIAPSPVNAHSPFAGSVFAGQMVLIVCAWGLFDSAHDWISFLEFF